MKYSDLQIVISSIKYLFLLSFIVLSASCKKEPEDPAPNPTYFDDMSATINGQAWKASCSPSWPGMGCTKVDCQYYEDTRGFEIVGIGYNYTIQFSTPGAFGGIVLGENIIPYRRTVFLCHKNSCGDATIPFELDTTHTNTLTIIDIDNTHKLIEGNFTLRAISYDKLDTVIIENGYFKTNYRP